MDSSIRASLERADQEIRQVLKKLDPSGSCLNVTQELPTGPIHVDAQHMDEDPKIGDMFRDANTQTPEGAFHDEGQEETGVNEATETHPDVSSSETQTEAAVQEQVIPIRLQMDSAEWYRRRATDQLWDVRSQVYIETTERTCVHLKDDKVTRPPYMQVTIEDVIVHCGETAQFDAVIDGSSPLTISWYKDNNRLKESDRLQMVKEDRKYSLIFQGTKRGDGGVYTCTASNSAGEVSCKAELIMHEDEKEQDTKILHKRRKLKSFFEVKEEIGRGCFGFVKRVVHKGNGATCAAKFIPLRSKTRQQAYRERDILSEVSHSRITHLLDAFETKKTLILILELCCGEELLDRLYRKHTFTEKEVKLYIRQLLEAVAYLHNKNILHLDIKPSNILISKSDKEEIKLCDFGFAQKIITSEYQYSQYGSPEFVPPEIACQAPVSKSSDIWPVGVISYLCLVSVSPFAGQNDRETLLNVQQGKISWSCPGFTQLSANAKDFMKLTIQMSPDARPSATDCIQHKWFAESASPEDTKPISSKNLRFLVARSRWQRSLMCYKSILVMRSIPELLNSKLESTSLGVPRHLVECSSSSSSSGSSSDNESDVSPTSRDCNPSLELHLSIFKMSEKDRMEQPYTVEPEPETDAKEILVEEKMESKDITLPGIHDTSPMNRHKREHNRVTGLGESQGELEEAEKMLIHSVETSPRKQPLNRAATIEVGVLASKKPKTGSFVRGTSADSALLLQRGIDKPPLVCVPRQSIINSMFYNQACEGPAMASKDGPFKEKEFIKHRERARRSLMKAGYSQKILSGLREPLLEQFAMEQRMMAQDKSMADRDGQLSSLKKSASFDAAKGPLRSSFKASSRSRSLDDYKSRPLSVYKGTFVEEVDQDHSKGAKGVINTFDTDTKHHAEGLLIPDDSARATSAPPEVHQYSAPVKVSSTQRPLSAPPIGRDNTIIAVLHQQASLDTFGTKERSSSAMLEGDEGTIIAFVKPKQTAESDSLATQPSAVIYDADKVRCTTHPTELVSEEKGQSLDISGGVKFTVHTICDKNDFLTSDTSTEKASDEVKYHEDSDKNKKRTEEVFSESTTQTPVQFLQFSDDNTRIAVIRQGTGEVLSLTRDITVLEEHEKCPVSVIQPCAPTLDFPIQITATTGPSGDRNLPDTITSQLSSNCYPIEKCTVTLVEDAEKVKPSIHHKLELGKDHHKEVFPSQILEHDIKVSLPTVHGDFSFQGRQSVSQDLQFSVYSDEQSATLEDLVGEMSSLSEEMDVLVSEQRQMGQGDIPFPPVIDQTKNPTGLQDAGNLTGDCLAMETDPSPLDQSAKEPQVTSISQCSFYESLSRAQVSPPYHEQFEEFTIESRSSSKTFISHSDSSGTGQRSDNFSDFEEGGRHSEVSLLEIGEIHQNRSSTSSELLTLGPFDFETTPSHLQNFYDIFTFPRQPLNIDKKSSSSNEQFNLSSVASQHATDFGETAMETSMEGALMDAKSGVQIQPSQSDPCKIASNERKSSRKRIKLFRPHGKSETVGKSTEQSLKQKVKASVANISRMIKGKQGNGKEGPSEVAKVHIHEQAAVTRISGPVKKKGLPSFKLPNLTAKDKAPAFVEELTDQTVVVGHLVTLSCRTAQPVTDVEWYKDGVTIHSSERVLISSTLKNYHLLTILVVNARDFGIYACVATNVLGSASTCCIIKKAEIPCCPSSPDVAQVYKDGALLVWKPVESSTPVTYFLQYRKEGEEWRALTLDVSDCCYTTHNLSEGHVYSFRIACISKAGMGPYSNPSVGVRIGRRSPGLSVAGETQGSSERELTSDLHVMGKRGRFSTVRLCTEISSGQALAAKIIPYTEERKEATLREYQILKKLHHTNLVQLHAAFLSPQHMVLVLELCEGRELLRCLSAGSSYSELEVRDYLWQMLSAVEFLHDKQILHLDLRSENTIVTEHKLVKILDFGDAQFYSPDKVITPQRYMDYFETMAPELVEGQGAAPPTDVWAVGITAFVMLSGDYPFSSDSGTELEKGMKKGLIRFSRCYAGLSGGAVCFLQSTLWANPWGRPSASDCLKTPWLQEAGLATLQEPPVFFPSEKLRGFLHERSKRERLAQSASSPPVQLSHPC